MASRARDRRPRPPLARRRLAGWILLLAASTAAVYSGAIHTPFLLDDPVHIAKNPTIQRPLSLPALLRDPRAVVTATLRANWAGGGLDVTGYHLVNVAAHVVAGTLVFLLAWRTLRLPLFGGRYDDRADTLAAVVALLFLLHPMQTESVTYVIQRAEVFAGAALAGALLANAAMRSGRGPGAMTLLAVSCVLGAWSKPSFAVVPALLAAYDLALPGDTARAALARRAPAYALATAAAVVTFILTQASGGFGAETAGFQIEGISALDYLSAQPGVVVQYLRVALWPDRLCFDCGYRGAWPVLAGPIGDSAALAVAVLALLIASAAALRRRQPLLLFAVVASAIALSPTSSAVPLADFYVEHRMYLPIAFMAMALVPMTHDAIGAAATRAGISRRGADAVRMAVAVAVLATLSAATMARNRVLADPLALMEDALEQAPQNERVQYNLANAYRRAGRPGDAIAHYEAAIRLLPDVVRSYQNLGSLYLEQDRVDDALRVFRAGAAAKPDVAMAHRNVAVALLRLGRADEALDSAQRALALDPDNAIGHRLAGDALSALGRTDDARRQWSAGLAARPGDAALSSRLANPAGR